MTPVGRSELEQIRDRILDNWRLSKRAESRERLAEALNRFITELAAPHSPIPAAMQSEQPPVITNLPTRTEYEELKQQMLNSQIGLKREIQKRDEQIAVLAEAIANLGSEPTTQTQTWENKATIFAEEVKWDA